jgi:hypothetical protein
LSEHREHLIVTEKVEHRAFEALHGYAEGALDALEGKNVAAAGERQEGA